MVPLKTKPLYKQTVWHRLAIENGAINLHVTQTHPLWAKPQSSPSQAFFFFIGEEKVQGLEGLYGYGWTDVYLCKLLAHRPLTACAFLSTVARGAKMSCNKV